MKIRVFVEKAKYKKLQHFINSQIIQKLDIKKTVKWQNNQFCYTREKLIGECLLKI